MKGRDEEDSVSRHHERRSPSTGSLDDGWKTESCNRQAEMSEFEDSDSLTSKFEA